MAYATANELREFCGFTADELPDQAAEEAIKYAQGFIERYCATRFEEPTTDTAYVYDGDGSSTIFAPAEDGPWASVTKIEYLDGDTWVEYDGDWWIRGGGEWLELSTTMEEGTRWRITARCWTSLNNFQLAMLKRVCLMIARLIVVRRDEPLGPSVRSMSLDGVSYTYQTVDQGHPTGVHEIDYLLNSLRRTVVRP